MTGINGIHSTSNTIKVRMVKEFKVSADEKLFLSNKKVNKNGRQ
jgi:hypothetical protein